MNKAYRIPVNGPMEKLTVWVQREILCYEGYDEKFLQKELETNPLWLAGTVRGDYRLLGICCRETGCEEEHIKLRTLQFIFHKIKRRRKSNTSSSPPLPD